ncbi:AzlD domain-containing protein [Microbacterium sp. NE2HP2]|uniref:AzlD domain-containing protein n=1 Tax=Microbacterium plantarum TaxID=1816425 RepID=A0ABV5ETI5_9MICO|nr:AzlD domain-containing protein [Microbacterium plantarum]MDD7943865.1 AzlD domain-containing protein [Microbacterium plantarum]
MSPWTGILVASIICVALKALGYLLPPRWFDGERAQRIIDQLTIALLSALVVVQTLGAGAAIVVDARLPAVAVAAVLLAARAPFLVVVAGAALVAAVLRAGGWAA